MNEMDHADQVVVRSEIEDGIATITLDSPQNRNALSARLRHQLLRRLQQAEADPAVRAVVLTGAGTVFCAGADLKEAAARRAGQPVDDTAPTMPQLLEAIMDGGTPVVARMNGPARAGGIGLVAACDLAIAPDTVTFAFTEVRIGVAPAIIAVPCLRRMHSRALSRYLLTGEQFTAAEAVTAGLLTRACPPEELDAEVARVTGALRLGAPTALARTKQLLAELPGMDRDASFELTERVSAEFFGSDEAAEGRQAFFEKRSPSWAG